MNNQTKINRINQAIRETENLLEDATTRYENSLKSLDMEIKENKELGNNDSANDHAREWVKEKEDRVNELKNHINKLNDMKAQIIG